MSKLVQNIINSTKSVIGLQPKAYYAYRSDIQLTIEDNKVTAVTAGILGVIEGCKNFLNSGSEQVVATDNFDGFKQKFNAIINNHSDVVDKLDDIVVFVESNAGVKYVLGAKYGLWKTSQAQMANDNLATIAVEFTSREGMEEAYSEYILTADISGIPTTTDYEAIEGLTIGNGQTTAKKVYLRVDSDETCYVLLPDNTVLTSTAGIIDEVWEGIAGRVKLIIPKDTTLLSISKTGFYGSQFSGHVGLVSKITTVDFSAVLELTSFSAPYATVVDAPNCALTAKSIGDFLFAAAANNPTASGVANFSGGNNATDRAITDYMNDTYNPFVGAAYEGASIDELLSIWIGLNLEQWAISLNGGY